MQRVDPAKKQGNIMYVNLRDNTFHLSSGTYTSVEDFNWYFVGCTWYGLYKLGDYKKMKERDIKYLVLAPTKDWEILKTCLKNPA